MIKQFITQYLKTFLFWLVFFAIHRLIFILFNQSYASDTPISSIFTSFLVGIRMDLSFTGYLMFLLFTGQFLMLIIRRKFCTKCFEYISYPLIVILTTFLLGDTNLYSYWGRHMDGEAIGFLKTPGIVMASLRWYEMVVFFLGVAIISACFIYLYKKTISKLDKTPDNPFSWKKWLIRMAVVLFSGAILILPIRGSLGVAPINTGVAYFSAHRFANHAAINPLWNLAYSMKRLDVTKKSYKFMDDNQAEAIFQQMMQESGDYPKLLNKKQPNIVVILLESFAAHTIEALGGNPVTPNFNKLVPEGVLFSNLYAAANRSDKGLVATLAGYQVLPSYSIIRFPDKTQSLTFLPKILKENGYNDLSYMYGGDIKFKNMNSFVTQAGFEEIISIDDFPDEFQGEKWGVHDQYTFNRLFDEMKESSEPYFKFFFTLSSHEPFDVPMDRVHKNDYHNSIHYTDKCLGEFFDTAKAEGLWDNTLFILIADHGVGGAEKLTIDTKRFNQIPMLWTGGALAKKDTVVSKVGSQTDMVQTLLNQLDIHNNELRFSKNILDQTTAGFAFFDYSDAFGYVEKDHFQVYDNRIKRFLHMEGTKGNLDSLKGKAYLQVLSNDHKKR
ncbi:MAG: sulfatase-like hydrolase/transferase [Marinilabiliaceae bacterium]|nr:sulfatase-like hydrolase/transferase [Marinilabiliaceae bacterium]